MCEVSYICTKVKTRSIHLQKDQWENGNMAASGEEEEEGKREVNLLFTVYLFLPFELFIVYYSFNVCMEFKKA